MNKIMYLSHIRWGWIKQRPQFLAEGLARENQVDYYYYQGRSHKSCDDYTTQEIDEGLHLTLHTYRRIPFSFIPIIGKWKLLEWINCLFIKSQLPNFKQYDVIWITSPFLYPLVKATPNNTCLVYDCMDDMAAFPDIKCDKNKVKDVINSERELLKRNRSVVFCSSDYLAKTITKRAGVQKEICVVNNAIELPKGRELCYEKDLPQDVKTKLDIVTGLSNVFMYIGTISEWIDFKMLEQLTKDIPDINIVLVGPVGGAKIPENPKIHVVGPINRDYIFTFMDKAKALIMPFVVNELIESVNPVKLYEYIYSGKPSIAPYYSESAPFSNFVRLYNNYEELNSIAKGVLSGNVITQSKDIIEKFIYNNTWKSRVNTIKREVEGHI